MDKFSELIAKGVAAFNQKPTAPSTVSLDVVSRTYNNIFSIATDTHMTPCDDDTYVITGHLIANGSEFDRFLYASTWKGVSFTTSGYWSFSDFMYKNSLIGKYDIYNSEPAYILSPINRDNNGGAVCACDCECSACKIGESIVPVSTGFLSRNHSYRDVRECFTGDVYQTIKALNENKDVIGSNWTPVFTSEGVKFACYENGTRYLI